MAVRHEQPWGKEESVASPHRSPVGRAGHCAWSHLTAIIAISQMATLPAQNGAVTQTLGQCTAHSTEGQGGPAWVDLGHSGLSRPYSVLGSQCQAGTSV